MLMANGVTENRGSYSLYQ